MGLQQYKPTSPSRRAMTSADFSMVTESRPLKKLVKGAKDRAGRNNQGRVTTRFHGGGHKQRYRQIDFARSKGAVPGRVAAIEYDPNRSARIARVHYADGDKRYILCPEQLKVNDRVLVSRNADIKPGNTLPLGVMPLGVFVHNVELKIGGGGQLVRAAGAAAQLMAKDGNWVQLRLPSGEVRKVHAQCKATIGQLGNVEHANVQWGKAGRMRWRGQRPHNRGVTMNPVDHPMGGGEGRTSGGRHPCSPWGQPAKGGKTRRNKATDKMIVMRRK